MIWFGADPGGKKNFGIAVIREDSTYETKCVDCADEAIDWIRELHGDIGGAGIDAPLWWSSRKSGDRKADEKLRKRGAGPIQSPNSLRGAILVQGVMLAARLRDVYLEVPITEAHPKALLRFFGKPWGKVKERFGLDGEDVLDHERDAVLAALAARERAIG